ncbi:MAG: hypothetical protein E7515_03205 [Ruminococcaceae bacterium]|nr:hypothetical protein [Oscillospiraceae bacterium]
MKNRILKILKSALLVLFVAFCSYYLLSEPAVVSRGIKNALATVGGVLLPTLFPFMALACFIENSGVSSFIGRAFSFPTRLLFRLPGEASAAVIMSLVGGYPVGARMTSQLFNDGKITKEQAARMYLFCINAGPAFVISTVGVSLLGSLRAGVIMFCSLTLSSLLTGFSAGFLFSKPVIKEKREVKVFEKSVFEAFTKSASQATGGFLSVSSYVLVFSAICEGIRALPLSKNITCFIFSFLEVTNGVMSAAGSFSLPVITAIIGFGGLCVHFQVMSFVLESGLKLRYFFVARAVNGALASGICRVLLYLFPIELSVFSSTDKMVSAPYSISLPCFVAFLLMSISLIFDIAPRKKV